MRNGICTVSDHLPRGPRSYTGREGRPDSREAGQGPPALELRVQGEQGPVTRVKFLPKVHCPRLVTKGRPSEGKRGHAAEQLACDLPGVRGTRVREGLQRRDSKTQLVVLSWTLCCGRRHRDR